MNIIMSSSASITAARNRRAGGSQAPPPPQNRPGTSIASQSAFAQQRGGGGGRTQPNQRGPLVQQDSNNGLPFSKLTISDAIGLITLRLGRVEQYIIDLQEEQGNNSSNSSVSHLPDNTKIIDNSVLTSMINRLDALEKKESSNASSTTNVYGEQIIKLEKDLRDTKDLLLSVILKLETLTSKTSDEFLQYKSSISNTEKNILEQLQSLSNETNEKFLDYESAIAEIEKNISIPSFDNDAVENTSLKEDFASLKDDIKNINIDVEEQSISENA